MGIENTSKENELELVYKALHYSFLVTRSDFQAYKCSYRTVLILVIFVSTNTNSCKYVHGN